MPEAEGGEGRERIICKSEKTVLHHWRRQTCRVAPGTWWETQAVFISVPRINGIRNFIRALGRGNPLPTWCRELTHGKRPWCWERLAAGGEGDGRGWDGWMASPTRWTWVWGSSGSWWWTGRPGELHSWGRRVGHDWLAELNSSFMLLYGRNRDSIVKQLSSHEYMF